MNVRTIIGADISFTDDSTALKKNKLLMFIGNRGTGASSRIKGLRRYGGKWKENIHSEAVNVCLANENMTSQTCVFCFNRLNHPLVEQINNGKCFMKKIQVTLYCTNPSCVSVLSRRAIKSRDSISALAISLVGLSTILFRSPFPTFQTHKVSEKNVEEHINITSAFNL